MKRTIVHKMIAIISVKGWLNFLPDKIYLKIAYWARIGKHLNLKQPRTFNEKIQWLKLYDRNPVYTQMVDKYEAKKYVASTIGEEYIIPTLGVWDNFDEIEFDQLPDQFVLKCTHDSGGIVICRDKSKLDIKAARSKIEESLRRNFYYEGREWPYKNVKPRIIVEKFVEDSNNINLMDFKLFCFNGKVKFVYVSENSHTQDQKLQFFDENFHTIECKRKDYKDYDDIPEKPVTYGKMVELAEKLSNSIPHVRVDFYEINQQVYFGEMTFYTGSGYIPFVDDKWNAEFGKYITTI